MVNLPSLRAEVPELDRLVAELAAEAPTAERGTAYRSSRSLTASPRSASASRNRRGLNAASGGCTPAAPPRATRSAAIAATVPVMAEEAERPVRSTAKS